MLVRQSAETWLGDTTTRTQIAPITVAAAAPLAWSATLGAWLDRHGASGRRSRTRWPASRRIPRHVDEVAP
jgi:hypothetical protein